MGFPRPNLARLSDRLRTIHLPERMRALFPTSVSSRIGFPQGLSAAGGLTLPYKLAVVAVMMLVAGGTLVTFGSAGAETTGVTGSTATATVGSAMPGTSEATPRVEGQILPQTTYDYSPDTSILSADDLLSNLKLTDYSPKSDDNKNDDDDNNNKSDDNKNDDDKKSSDSTKKPTAKPTAKPTDKPTQKPTDNPAPKPTDEPKNDDDDGDDDQKSEGDKHKKYEKCVDNIDKAGGKGADNLKKSVCGKEPDYED